MIALIVSLLLQVKVATPTPIVIKMDPKSERSAEVKFLDGGTHIVNSGGREIASVDNDGNVTCNIEPCAEELKLFMQAAGCVNKESVKNGR